MIKIPVDVRDAHRDEHTVPVRVVESRLAAFQIGRNPLGAVFNRVGSVGGTEESANGHDVAGAARNVSQEVQGGDV
jgi:hypothetical protein